MIHSPTLIIYEKKFSNYSFQKLINFNLNLHTIHSTYFFFIGLLNVFRYPKVRSNITAFNGMNFSWLLGFGFDALYICNIMWRIFRVVKYIYSMTIGRMFHTEHFLALLTWLQMMVADSWLVDQIFNKQILNKQNTLKYIILVH